MALPETLDEMRSMGYKFDGDGVCKYCGDEIEWWFTPNGKKIPMNSMNGGRSPAVAHWTVCDRDAD